MTAIVGYLGLATGFFSAFLLVFHGFRGMSQRAVASENGLRSSVLGLLGGATVAMLALEVGLLRDDFSINYVANNSASTTPLFYKVASAWSALEGSIVLWGLVLAVFTYSLYRSHARRDDPDPLGSGALAIMGLVSVFFFGMMLTISNPFSVCVVPSSVGCLQAASLPWTSSVAALAGTGPNPLLQNHPLMALHPPTLYVGYVGLTVPFSLAMAALLMGSSGSEWLRRTRTWTLIAWMFLTLGIVLGGLWSYEVLGWGGFWAWDPVENASFLPWLVATAFLHSSVVQARRGMLQAWNFVLVIAAFSMTILGTFLTRSGVIVSVHSFTQSPVGPALLWFLMVVLVGSLGLFAARVHVVASSPRLDSMMSREGVFLVNNLLLTVLAFVVLIGTLYPMLVEAVTGEQVGVGRPFFDRLAVPLFLILLVAMALGPIFPYRAAGPSTVWGRIQKPLQIALLTSAALVVFGQRNFYVVISVLLATFIVAVIGLNLLTAARKVADNRGLSMTVAALRVMRSDGGYWGGQISHLGVAFLALGIALSANLAIDTTVTLVPGQTASVAGRDLTYAQHVVRQEPNRTATGARIEVGRDGTVEAILEPRLNQYPGSRQPIATPATDASLTGDLYLSLESITEESVSLRVFWFPFIWLVWVGGLVTAFAVLWSRLVRKPKSVPSSTEKKAKVLVDA